MRRVEFCLAVLCCLVLAAGCATVPTTGGVQHHDPEQVGLGSGVQVAPLPPTDGASQLLVVEGFLHAMSAYEPGYQVARQYLTTEAALRWAPESGVQIYADGYPPVEIDQTVVLSAPIVGTLDAAGLYRPTSGQLRLDFGLVKNANGQWRISSPPKGLVVSKYLFATGFSPVNANFLAASGEVLLPEPRYFANGDQALLDAVSAVLSGPSAWLAPATRPSSAAAVRVLSAQADLTGVAWVTLSSAAGQLNDAQREQLQAEITFTLTSFEQVDSVQISASGETWTDASGRSQLTRDGFAELDPSDAAAPRLLFVAKGDQLLRQASAGSWSDFVRAATALPKTQALAVSRGTDAWAAVTENRTRLVEGEAQNDRRRPVRSGSKLLRPFYSRTGELWSPAAASLAALRIYRNGQPIAVTVRGGAEGAVVAAALAPDGNRLALVMAKGNLTSVGLMRVNASEAGVVIDGWRELDLNVLGVTSVRLLDVGWNSVTDLALLRTDADQQTSVIVLSQDGAQMSDIGPSDSTRFSSMLVVPGRQAVVRSALGGLYRFDGEFNWLAGANDVDAAAYSG